MWLLALEACGATLLFIFIVWWTMFCGRKPEPPSHSNRNESERNPETTD